MFIVCLSHTGETDLTLPLNAKDTGVNSVSTNISCKAHYSSTYLTDPDIDDEPIMEILMTGVDLRPKKGMTEDRGPKETSTYAAVVPSITFCTFSVLT